METTKKFLLLLVFLISQTSGIEFYYTLMHRAEHCFEEHLAGQTLVNGEIYFAKKGEILLSITDPSEDEILTRVFFWIISKNKKELKGEKNNRYSFTTSISGRYTICLTNRLLTPTELRFKMSQGVEEPEKPIVDDSEIKAMERQTFKLKDLSAYLHKEMADLRKTSNDEQIISNATTTRVIIFGVLSVLIILGSAFIQIVYLRSFFRQKKIM